MTGTTPNVSSCQRMGSEAANLNALNLGPYYYNTSIAIGPETISEPRIVQLPAYGLRHDEIKIKEIDGVLTVKSEPVDKTKYAATINKSYALKNVIVQNKTLVAGVLRIEFVDSENVIHHTINEGIDY
jgi:hypothetical protein